MEIIRRPFVVLWKLYFFLSFILLLLVAYPLYMYFLRKRSSFPMAFALVKAQATFLSYITGVFLIVKGKSNFPKKPYVLVSNHSSYFDILLMYALVPEYFVFMGKAELEQWPLFNIFFTKGMNIAVARGSLSGARKAYERANDELQRGNSLVIFPEATIPEDVPNMLKFKVGAFKLAVEHQVPIVPVTFTRNYKILQNGGFLKAPAGPGLAPAIVHKPIETRGMGEDDILPLLNKTFEIVKSALPDYENR